MANNNNNNNAPAAPTIPVEVSLSYADVGQSYRHAGQSPLDYKLTINTIAELINLGPSSNKAFTYY